MISFNLDRISYFKQKNLNEQHVPQIRATVFVLQIGNVQKFQKLILIKPYEFSLVYKSMIFLHVQSRSPLGTEENTTTKTKICCLINEQQQFYCQIRPKNYFQRGKKCQKSRSVWKPLPH